MAGWKKVFINVNKQIGSAKSGSNSDRNKVALRTGNFSGTTLQIDIGSSGRIQGAGGNGRQGTTSSGKPSQAFTGTSGLGIEYPAEINNSGTIRCGYGGGGGGAGSNSNPNKNPRDFGRSGGGGGGGAGIPAGMMVVPKMQVDMEVWKGKDLSDQMEKVKAGGCNF